MRNLGLLLDVDGPVASPVTRSLAIPSIAADIVALAAAQVPIAFVTGRSDAFARERLVPPLLAAGLAAALRVPGSRVFGVFERGGVWAPFTADGLAPVTVDESVVPSGALVDGIRMLVRRDFADTMFFDETKRAMISVEQRTDVSSADYLAAQPRFEAAAFDVVVEHGLGVHLLDRVRPDVNGEVLWRFEASIIASDIQAEKLTKDVAAGRALDHFRARGPLPRRWFSVGDSRGDYLMADRLHAEGFEVAHVDVRPAEGVLERPYPVVTIDGAVNDEAGAEFLRRCVAESR